MTETTNTGFKTSDKYKEKMKKGVSKLMKTKIGNFIDQEDRDFVEKVIAEHKEIAISPSIDSAIPIKRDPSHPSCNPTVRDLLKLTIKHTETEIPEAIHNFFKEKNDSNIKEYTKNLKNQLISKYSKSKYIFFVLSIKFTNTLHHCCCLNYYFLDNFTIDIILLAYYRLNLTRLNLTRLNLTYEIKPYEI